MGRSGHVLLTGATGFLGRYLLRELQMSGQSVVVLVRGSHKQSAVDRITAAMSQWPGSPAPVIVEGDLSQPGLGLATEDRRWIARHCSTVVHAAARTALLGTPDGEPWRSNVEGTQHLLELCRQLGIVDFHHVSTAFVCGNRTDVIREEELECGQEFHNPYERSKYEAERRVRQAEFLEPTIYRPSVIVGDSRTGFTSVYQGFYRFVAVDLLGLDGVRWAGIGPLNAPTTLEELFLEHIREYWPYFRSDPVFDCGQTMTALPHLPPPSLDRTLLTRLIRFGIADRWGRARRGKPAKNDAVDVADYVERFFSQNAPLSSLASLPLEIVIALDIHGCRDGQWSCEWRAGTLTDVRRGIRPDAELTYRMDVATFAAVVRGDLAAPDAFFARQIEAHGDIEKALKLAVLFGEFVKEFPYHPLSCQEKVENVACPG